MKAPGFGALATGILLTVFTGLIFATVDSISKSLMASLPVVQIVWSRYLVQTTVTTTYLAATTGTRFLRTRRPVLQLLRGVALLASSLSMYVALAHVPIGDATAILFFSPVIVTVLSSLFLGEKIGIHRIASIGAAIIGVLLIVRPGGDGASPYLLLPLFAAFSNALYLLLTRQLAGQEEAAATQFNTTAIGTVLLFGAVVMAWQRPTVEEVAILIGIGFMAATAHFTLVRAFSYASAALLSPFLYSQLLFATLFGLLFFGETPRISMAIGAIILVASGLYIWWRENRALLAREQRDA